MLSLFSLKSVGGKGKRARVRTLRVPARRLGALTRGASLDERKVSLGDHFGNKN